IQLYKSKKKLCPPDSVIFLARGSGFPAAITRVIAAIKALLPIFYDCTKAAEYYEVSNTLNLIDESR
ncbi:MAG: hypothetical protein PVF37_22580, partial [Desulfobacterales bacterium]